jgi:hypothetical protein
MNHESYKNVTYNAVGREHKVSFFECIASFSASLGQIASV